MDNRRTPRVSVIIIFLNEEQFISEAISSVFAQTFQDWELLLVDDGSEDGSSLIAHQAARRHPERVRYLEHFGHVNRGMSATRNLGVDHARGEYIAFLDADDAWLPEKLDQQVAALDAHPEVAMVYGPTEWWFSWSGEDVDRDFTHDLGVPANVAIQPGELVQPLFFDQEASVPCTCSMLVRREAFLAVGRFEESFTGMYEDQVFLAKLCLAFPIMALEECLDRYRQHPISTVALAEREGRTFQARGHFLEWLAGYLEVQSIDDPEKIRGMRRALEPYEHPNRHRLRGAVPVFRHLAFRCVLAVSKVTMPTAMRRKLWSIWTRTPYEPAPGAVRFGSLRRTEPLSREFGYDRGLPVDRYYIERFLEQHVDAIYGRVLEIADNEYTVRYGGDRVTTSDVLHVVEGNPKATFVGDLTTADHIPSCTFDCVIFTQTLQLIYDPVAALRTIHRILKPGGTVLATFPGISPISRYDSDRWGYYWSFTSGSAQRMFSEAFACGSVDVESRGNVLAASAMLYGLASEELTPAELDHDDPDFEVIITVCATRSPVLSPDTAVRHAMNGRHTLVVE